MGTVTARKRRDGSVGYTAQIRIKRKGKLAHNETQTFDRRPAAKAWLQRREEQLRQPGALERAMQPDPPLRDVIDRYIKESERDLGRTKAQVLGTIKTRDIADLRCGAIDSVAIVAFARELAVEPQTRGNYMSHLSSIFTVARPAWGYPLDAQCMADAMVVLRKLKLVSKSRQRTRRPTLEELDRLMTFFVERQKRRTWASPMTWAIAFAIFGLRRQEEICSIRKPDHEPAQHRMLVRDMKNPEETEGNDVWCDMTPEAERLVAAAPMVAGDDRIFPYHPDGVSAAFTNACRMLRIEDLHFHDLRHEGISRLFEIGWTIPRVALVSGHRSWASLQRYAHIRQVGDKYEGWPWLDRLTGQPALASCPASLTAAARRSSR